MSTKVICQTVKEISIPNQAQIILGNNFRMSILSSSIIRFEFSRRNIFFDHPSSFVKNRELGNVEFSKNINNGILTVTTKDLILKYVLNAPLNAKTFIIFSRNCDKIWHFGDPQILNIKEEIAIYDCFNELEHSLFFQNGLVAYDDYQNDLFYASKYNKRFDDNIDLYILGFGNNYFEGFPLFAKLTGINRYLSKFEINVFHKAKQNDYFESEETTIRYFQSSIFQPLLRHSTIAMVNPYQFENFENVSIIRNVLKFRKTLTPFFFSLFFHFYLTAQPFIYSNQVLSKTTLTHQLTNKFYVLHSKLIVGVIEKFDESHSIGQFRAKIPTGIYYDYFNKMIVKGGKRIELYYPLNSYPLLIQSGGILVREENSIYIIEVFPGSKGEMTYYEGESDASYFKMLLRFNQVGKKHAQFTLSSSNLNFTKKEKMNIKIMFHYVSPFTIAKYRDKRVEGSFLNEDCLTISLVLEDYERDLSIKLFNPTSINILNKNSYLINLWDRYCDDFQLSYEEKALVLNLLNQISTCKKSELLKQLRGLKINSSLKTILKSTIKL